MALTKVTGNVVKTTTDLTINNLTGVAATFTGNVSVGGTLTYEDVTSIESVGVITAKNNIDAQKDVLVGAGVSVVGVTTSTGGFVGALTGNVTGTASNASGATGDFSIADKIIHTGDTNTAIRFPTADTITAETGGSERLRITSAGSVGINSTSPDRRFTLHQDATCRMNLKSLSNSTAGIEFGDEADHNAGYIVYDNTDNSFQVGLNGTGEKLRIASNAVITATQANSAIGLILKNTAHDSQLQILATAANKNSVIWFGDNGDGNIGWIDYDHNDNSMSFRVNGSTRAWFDNSNTLYLQGTSHTNLEVRSNSASTKGVIQTVQDSDVRMGATTNHPLALYAGSNERMRIDSSGDISIGNAAGYAVWNNTGNDQRPRFQLKQTGGDDRGVVFLEERGDANGMDVFISKSRGGSGAGAITSGDTLGFLKWSGGDGTRQHNAAGIGVWNDGTVATGRVAGNMSIYTAPDSASSMLERIRIDSSGVVHLKSNTSAQNTTKELRFSPTTSSNRYATVQAINRSGNNHIELQFFTADADTPAERLRITSTGQLLIGTTSSSDQFHLLKSHNGHTRLVVQNNWGSNATAQLKLISPTDEFQLIKYASGDAALNLSNAANIYFSIGGSEKLRIDSGGRTLIGGTTSSRNEAKLQVFGTSDTNYITMQNTSPSDSDGNRYGKFIYRGTQSGGEVSDLVHLQANHDGSADDQKGRFIIKTNDGSDGNSPTERIRFQADGDISIGGKTNYPLCRTPSSSRGMEIDYNRWRSPEDHSSGISSWVLLGNDYGPNPYPVRTFKIAVPESGVEGSRVYQVWHDGDANYDYGGMWEIRINQWTSNARFESVAIRCVNGKRDDMCVRAYNDSTGIMIRPSTIWGRVYLRLAGYDSGQGYRGSSYCAVANNAALAIYNGNGSDDGSVPTGGSPVDVFPFDGHGGSYTGGRDIENSNNFNA